MPRMLRIQFPFNPCQRILQLEPSPIQNPICRLQRPNFLPRESGPPQPHQVQPLRSHVEIRIQKYGGTSLFTRELPPIIASLPILEN